MKLRVKLKRGTVHLPCSLAPDYARESDLAGQVTSIKVVCAGMVLWASLGDNTYGQQFETEVVDDDLTCFTRDEVRAMFSVCKE